MSPGQIAYEAHVGSYTDHRHFPEWEDLPELEKDRWAQVEEEIENKLCAEPLPS